MKIGKEILLMLSVFLLLKGTNAETQEVNINWTAEGEEKTTGKSLLIMVN